MKTRSHKQQQEGGANQSDQKETNSSSVEHQQHTPSSSKALEDSERRTEHQQEDLLTSISIPHRNIRSLKSGALMKPSNAPNGGGNAGGQGGKTEDSGQRVATTSQITTKLLGSQPFPIQTASQENAAHSNVSSPRAMAVASLFPEQSSIASPLGSHPSDEKIFVPHPNDV